MLVSLFRKNRIRKLRENKEKKEVKEIRKITVSSRGGEYERKTRIEEKRIKKKKEERLRYVNGII